MKVPANFTLLLDQFSFPILIGKCAHTKMQQNFISIVMSRLCIRAEEIPSVHIEPYSYQGLSYPYDRPTSCSMHVGRLKILLGSTSKFVKL